VPLSPGPSIVRISSTTRLSICPLRSLHLPHAPVSCRDSVWTVSHPPKKNPINGFRVDLKSRAGYDGSQGCLGRWFCSLSVARCWVAQGWCDCWLRWLSGVVGAGSRARRGWLGAGSLMVCGSACSHCSWVVVVGIHARCRWLLRGSLLVGVTGSLCVAPAGLLMVRVRIRFGSCAHDFNDSHR